MDEIRLTGFILCAASIVIGAGLWVSSRKHRVSDDPTEQGHIQRSVGSHLAAFLLGSFAIFLLVVGLLLISGPAYVWLKNGLLSDRTPLDPQSFMAIAATAAAVPVAFAGSMYAIYLALLGLQGSQHQITLAKQANILSDPLYDLSQRALSAYRRLEFLNGALITEYRSLRHQLLNLSYREGAAATPPSSLSAYLEVKRKFRELMFDEAFVVASTAAARQAEATTTLGSQGIGEHQLRRAFSKALEAMSVESEGIEANRLDAKSLNEDGIRVMSAAFFLSDSLERGAKAIKDYSHGKLDLEAPDRLLAYMKQWMPTVNAWDTGRDLGKAARSLSFAGEDFLAKMFGTWNLEEATLYYKEQVFISKRERESSLGVVSWCGDHDTVMSLEEALIRLGESVGLKSRRVSHLALGSMDDIQKYDGFQVITCHADDLRTIANKGGLGAKFQGAVIIDGIRSQAVHWIEDLIEKDLQQHVKAKKKIDEKVESEWAELEAKLEDLFEQKSQLEAEWLKRIAQSDGCDLNSQEMLESKRKIEEIDKVISNAPSRIQLKARIENSEPVPSRGSDFEVFCQIMRGSSETSGIPNALWIGVDYREIGEPPVDRVDSIGAAKRSLFDILGGRGRLASAEIARFVGL